VRNGYGRIGHIADIAAADSRSKVLYGPQKKRCVGGAVMEYQKIKPSMGWGGKSQK